VGKSDSCPAVGVAEEERARAGIGLLVGVGALGFSLRNSQRDPDCRGEIIYVPVNLYRIAHRDLTSRLFTGRPQVSPPQVTAEPRAPLARGARSGTRSFEVK